MGFVGRALVPLALLVSACGGSPRGAVALHAERLSSPSHHVTEEGFSEAAHDLLLSEPRSAERAIRLRGVVERQLLRAGGREEDRAAQATEGALQLVRTDDVSPDFYAALPTAPLSRAAEIHARRGDEGKAMALYELLRRSAKGRDKDDAEEHLRALEVWVRDVVARSGGLVAAGALERVMVRRRLMDPSKEALEQALTQTTDWIRRAIELRAQASTSRPTREDVVEAYRALKTGALVLVALMLKDGDASGALRAVERAEARSLLRPEIAHALEKAAEGSDPRAWQRLVHVLRPLLSDEELEDERELFRRALFGVAAEAYRLDPTALEPAGVVSAAMEEGAMAEVVPRVLALATRASGGEPDTLGGALAMTMHAMGMEIDAEDYAAVRRTYRAAESLLSQVEAVRSKTKVEPSPARVHALMAEVELREGRLSEAKRLLSASAASERSGQVLLSLARIEWKQKELSEALTHLTQAREGGDTKRDAALEGEIFLAEAEIAVELGRTQEAGASLAQALRVLARARLSPKEMEERARLERVLSKVLDRFGEAKHAERALERAFEAAPRDRAQVSATIGLAIGRALVRGELGPARDALVRALMADLPPEELVYFALWVRLLERDLRVSSDKTPDRVFAMVSGSTKWVGALAQFGAGKLAASELERSAKTPTQKLEATFYGAMEKRLRGDTKGAEDALREVASSAGITLSETALARELLLGKKGLVFGGPPPGDVRIP